MTVAIVLMVDGDIVQDSIQYCEGKVDGLQSIFEATVASKLAQAEYRLVINDEVKVIGEQKDGVNTFRISKDKYTRRYTPEEFTRIIERVKRRVEEIKAERGDRR